MAIIEGRDPETVDNYGATREEKQPLFRPSSPEVIEALPSTSTSYPSRCRPRRKSPRRAADPGGKVPGGSPAGS